MRQVVGSRIWDSGLSKLIAFAERLLTVAYRPRPDERAYLERAKTQKNSDVEVTAAALSDRESQAFFRVRMARKGMQPVWIDIRNGSGNAFRLEPFSIDPAYYPPLEAAYVNHFAMLKRLLSFGLLAWIFLPVLQLLPFKLYGAGKANRRMNAFFKQHGYPGGPIPPGGGWPQGRGGPCTYQRTSFFLCVGIERMT